MSNRVTNTVEAFGQTFTRKGKPMTHVVAFRYGQVQGSFGRVHVEWASSEELARKNHLSHAKRWAKAQNGETLNYPWSTEYYRAIEDLQILPVVHS